MKKEEESRDIRERLWYTYNDGRASCEACDSASWFGGPLLYLDF